MNKYTFGGGATTAFGTHPDFENFPSGKPPFLGVSHRNCTWRTCRVSHIQFFFPFAAQFLHPWRRIVVRCFGLGYNRYKGRQLVLRLRLDQKSRRVCVVVGSSSLLTPIPRTIS